MKLVFPSLLVVVLVTIAQNDVNALKILGVFPMISRSHYIVGHALMKGLADAGHEVTIICPFRQKNPIKNYKEIFLEGLLEQLLQGMCFLFNFSNRRTIPISSLLFAGALNINFLEFSKMNYLENALMIYHMGVEGTNLTLTNPAFVEFLATKQHFDIAIIEMFVSDAMLGLGLHFNAPVISVSTFGAHKWTTDLVGTPNIASYIPNTFLGFTDQMTFVQRLKNSLATWFDDIVMPILHDPKQREMYRKHFGGEGKPTLDELKQNVSLVLLNTHVTLGFPRPYAPNMIEVGGMHINRNVSKLPNELQTFLDGAKEGSIYFSMGSNIKSAMFPAGKLTELLNVFGEFKNIRVLFKGEVKDNAELANASSNTLIQSWFPQEAVLAHPKIKIFVTHGGLLSTTESIYFGVPVVGIPVFGDQQMNMAIAQNKGFGLTIDLPTLSGTTLRSAIKEILGNPSYSLQAKTTSARYRDQIKSPIDTAVYWVEYVARHGGAPHLHSAAVHLPFYQYHNLDVSLVLLLAVLIPILIIKKGISALCRGSSNKLQPKKKLN